MENITKMRNALKTFLDASADAAKEIKRNGETYQHDAMLEANRIVAARRNAAKDAARAEIEAAAAAGKAKAEAWGRMDGAKITEDAKLLQFSMTPEQFKELVERHRGNGTMIHLLAQYGTEQNAKNGAGLYQHVEKYFPVAELPTLEGKISAYSKFASYAMQLLPRIEEHPDLSGIIEEVDNFGVRHPGTPEPLLDAIE